MNLVMAFAAPLLLWALVGAAWLAAWAVGRLLEWATRRRAGEGRH